jgi:hypothetical protein
LHKPGSMLAYKVVQVMKSALVLSMLYNYIDVTDGCLLLAPRSIHTQQPERSFICSTCIHAPEPVVNHKLYKLWKQLSKRVHRSLAVSFELSTQPAQLYIIISLLICVRIDCRVRVFQFWAHAFWHLPPMRKSECCFIMCDYASKCQLTLKALFASKF